MELLRQGLGGDGGAVLPGLFVGIGQGLDDLFGAGIGGGVLVLQFPLGLPLPALVCEFVRCIPERVAHPADGGQAQLAGGPVVGVDHGVDRRDEALHAEADDPQNAFENERGDVFDAVPDLLEALADRFVGARKGDQRTHQHPDEGDDQQDGVGVHGHVEGGLPGGGRGCGGDELCHQRRGQAGEVGADAAQRRGELIQRP